MCEIPPTDNYNYLEFTVKNLSQMLQCLKFQILHEARTRAAVVFVVSLS